eukprot:gnl/MRDRNA2_/MRDRNA2_283061_c0_seq1.p1 gnl/MRDRNA2_/MRDRNA2_283061_c0~~gnl/MRDRNA2_/MRDRNA2_283061_c0_seq1.p1  ORF type:complete len:233 (+),score=50.86 gnl/MRDRNA2_/MRDRNA2_283061_c0_seq1:84-701(+)
MKESWKEETVLGTEAQKSLRNSSRERTGLKHKNPLERQIHFGELLERILDLRATNPAMVKHMVYLEKALRLNHSKTSRQLFEMQSQFDELADKQSTRHKKIKSVLREIHSDISKRQRKMMARQEQIITIALSHVKQTNHDDESPKKCTTRSLWKSRLLSNFVIKGVIRRKKKRRGAALSREAQTTTTKAEGMNTNAGCCKKVFSI